MKIVGIILVLLVLTLVFGVIQRLWPAQVIERDAQSWRTDLAYWVFNPLVTVTIRRIVLILLALPLLLFMTADDLRQSIELGWGPIGSLPGWQQMLLALFLGDFIGYWLHRTFHGRRLWKFHAIHHSAEHLDWLAAARVHPVNDILSRAVQAVPLIGLGFSTGVLAAYVPVVGFLGLLLHANVSWDFGPLRWVIASPRFHRWHHTAEEEGRDKNFAGAFPIWDILFGTYYMPDREPQRFGAGDDVPQTLWKQLWYPFEADPTVPVD